MKTQLHSLHHLGLPACAVNQHGRIIYWNHYATDLLGLSAEQALGAEWHTVVHTVRTSGCCALCQTRHLLRQGQAISPQEVDLSVGGCYRTVTMLPLLLGSETEPILAFMILAPQPARQPDNQPIPLHGRVRQLDDDRIIAELTARERQILDCVVDGMDARSIAAQLGITHATARNYVQRILNKLGARNKAEAVSVALTYNLLAS